MAHKVFVSFDYTDDKHYKYLLEAWNKNPKFDFFFDDGTSDEIDSNNVGRIKAALTLKIKDATHILVIVGKNANTRHRNSHLIGFRNWINFEINKAVELGKRVVVVKLDRSYTDPDELSGVNASCVYSFNEADIIRALDSAPFLPRNTYMRYA